MNDSSSRAIAIVGLGAILPDAMNVAEFWENILNKRYSITDVPPERWSAEDYYDPDPTAEDKTYSKIGGWVRGFEFNWKSYHVPPKVAAAMDEGQKWAVEITAQVLEDYGYPSRPLDLENTAVILGTAMGGEMHYLTYAKTAFPEYARALKSVTEFTGLPSDLRQTILQGWQERIGEQFPPVTEDFDAWRAGQRYLRPGSEYLQYARPELHYRCCLRRQPGCHASIRRAARGTQSRCRPDGRRGS